MWSRSVLLPLIRVLYASRARHAIDTTTFGLTSLNYHVVISKFRVFERSELGLEFLAENFIPNLYFFLNLWIIKCRSYVYFNTHSNWVGRWVTQWDHLFKNVLYLLDGFKLLARSVTTFLKGLGEAYRFEILWCYMDSWWGLAIKFWGLVAPPILSIWTLFFWASFWHFLTLKSPVTSVEMNDYLKSINK